MIDICFLQIRDNFKNLRFVFSFLIIIILFILNALFFSTKIESRIDQVNKEVTQNYNELKDVSNNLNRLVFQTHLVIKKPLKSEFIINGSQDEFPEGYMLNVSTIDLPRKFFYNNQGTIKLPPVDWHFIISFILSFLVFILTYDSISSEKENGTFKLVFSTGISKLHYLLGKISGVTLSIVIPLLLGIILNLLIITVLGKIAIDGDVLLRVLILIFYSFIYILFFVTLGMFVSLLSNNSIKALIICSLLWISFVVIIPVIMKISITNIVNVPSKNDLKIELNQADNRLVEFLSKNGAGARGVEAGKIDDYKNERGEAIAYKELANLKQKIQNNYLAKKIRQASVFYSFSSISPIILFQQVFERLFSTGLEREKRVFTQTEEHQETLREFYRNRDLKDGSSPHIHFLGGYLSNDKTNIADIPKFNEKKPSILLSIQNSGILFLYLLVEFLIIIGLICVFFEKTALI